MRRKHPLWMVMAFTGWWLAAAAATSDGAPAFSRPADVERTSAGDVDAAAEDPFRFELKVATGSHRGPAVEGYLYSALPWTIGNVRLLVETLDLAGQVRGEAYGWALGHVPARGRTYFFVRISTLGATYRARVVSFDKISREPQSP